MRMAGRFQGLRRHRPFRGAVVGLLASVAVAGPVLAADQFEPNDSQAKATKLQPGKTYEGDIDKLDDAITQTKGDVDWYSLNAAAGKIDVAYTALQTQGSCFGPEARLLDAAGTNLGTAQPAKGDTEHIRYTATADGVLYLRVQQYQIDTCNAPMPYLLEPDFTAAQGGGGGGGNNSIDGLKIKAKDTQRQSGNKVKVKLKVGAAEAIDIAAKGTVKAGKKRVKLSKTVAAVAAGKTVKLVLSARGKAAKRIIAAIDDGKKVKAKVKVAVADSEGARAAQGLTITLR